jgi:hypothetical protein
MSNPACSSIVRPPTGKKRLNNQYLRNFRFSVGGGVRVCGGKGTEVVGVGVCLCVRGGGGGGMVRDDGGSKGGAGGDGGGGSSGGGGGEGVVVVIMMIVTVV